MIHQPEGGSQGQASEVLSESEEVMRIRRSSWSDLCRTNRSTI